MKLKLCEIQVSPIKTCEKANYSFKCNIASTSWLAWFFWNCNKTVYTVKILKIRTAEKFAVIILKFEQSGLTIVKYIKKMQMNGRKSTPWSDCS